MAFERILVVNDDGLDAPGLGALVAALSDHHEVVVVAPDRERSGVSQAFTLFNPLRADPSPERFPRGVASEVYRCSGMPADCVKIALLELFKDAPPDLVVSGVNHGANMGPDVHYSGTVAGAREALMNGLPAMAVSLVTSRGDEDSDLSHPHFGIAGDWALRLVDELAEELRRGVEEGFLLNVNVPNRRPGTIEGWRGTTLAHARYADGYIVHTDPSGRPHYWLEGTLELRDDREDSDVATVRRGEVSVTPVSVALTDPAALGRLQGS